MKTTSHARSNNLRHGHLGLTSKPEGMVHQMKDPVLFQIAAEAVGTGAARINRDILTAMGFLGEWNGRVLQKAQPLGVFLGEIRAASRSRTRPVGIAQRGVWQAISRAREAW